jgi:hypothetical protein
MATIKQINANRKNALLSKGPKSNLGKLTSSKNSLKHGKLKKSTSIMIENTYVINYPSYL